MSAVDNQSLKGGQTVDPPSGHIVTRTQKYRPCCHWTKRRWTLYQRIIIEYIRQSGEQSGHGLESEAKLSSLLIVSNILPSSPPSTGQTSFATPPFLA